MPAVIRRLPPALLQREELIAKIDEGGVFALAAQLELEQAAVERQRLFDVADLERDVVETDGARLLRYWAWELSVSESCGGGPAPMQSVSLGSPKVASAAGFVGTEDNQKERNCHEHPARMTTTCCPKVAEGTKQVEAANEQTSREPCTVIEPNCGSD